MVIALAFVVPTLCGQVFTPSRPLLTATRKTLLLVAASVLLQLVSGLRPELAPVLVPASFAGGTAAVTSIVWTSGRHRGPTAVAALGGLANLIPIARYGAMPVQLAGRQAFSSDALAEPSLISAKHLEMAMPVGMQNPISLLIDCVPLPAINAMVSIGDVLLMVALIWLGAANALAARRQPTP